MSDQLRGFSMMAYEGAISCTAAFGGGCRLFISSLEREREREKVVPAMKRLPGYVVADVSEAGAIWDPRGE